MDIMKREPIIIKINSKQFTGDMCDKLIIKTMEETAKCLCEKVQGSLIGYTCNGEIVIAISWNSPFKTEPSEQDSTVDNIMQRLCSYVSSMTTMAFHMILEDNLKQFKEIPRQLITSEWEKINKQIREYEKLLESGVIFCAICFKGDVAEYIISRQHDIGVGKYILKSYEARDLYPGQGIEYVPVWYIDNKSYESDNERREYINTMLNK